MVNQNKILKSLKNLGCISMTWFWAKKQVFEMKNCSISGFPHSLVCLDKYARILKQCDYPDYFLGQ